MLTGHHYALLTNWSILLNYVRHVIDIESTDHDRASQIIIHTVVAVNSSLVIT